MSTRNGAQRQRGMTLIDLVVAIVIVAIALEAIVEVFANVVRTSADPLVRVQMQAIADQLMEEIRLRPFVDPQGDAYTTPVAASARTAFDDIDDYEEYQTNVNGNTGIVSIDGTAIPALAGYRAIVRVQNMLLPDIPANDARRITITVTVGADTLVLVGWRTRYA